MKKFLTIALLLSVAFSAAAQNNSYAIDDECYAYLQKMEITVSDVTTDEFEAAADNLLETAVRKKDVKAQAIYYSMILRRVCNKGRKAPDSERAEWNAKVEEALAVSKKIALSTGYTQYYYYSTELVQIYYANTGQATRAMEMLADMLRDAIERGDEYGQWQSHSFMAKLYLRRGDDLSARPYLTKAINIWETTSDPMIQKQSVTRLFHDLGETFEPGSDSMKVCFTNAARYAKSGTDSLRATFCLAQIAAWDCNRAEFRRLCAQAGDPKLFSRIVPSGSEFIGVLDDILSQKPLAEIKDDILNVRGIHQKYFIFCLARKMGQYETAAFAADLYISSSRTNFAAISGEHLEELSARMGNDSLNAELARASQKIARITILLAVFLTIIFLGIIAVALNHLRSLRRTKQRDEERIAELQSANEKVRIADAAKTRFVQNMSHEVRTPLNAIVGFSQLLALPDGSFPDGEKNEFSGHIINNTKMLTMLLDDILNASAMDKGEYKITYEEGEMHVMAREAISSAEHRLQPGVKLYYQPESEEPFNFTTDPRRVQQILINLITNSCKHTKQGEIKVTSSLTAKPGFVTYAVTDTGPGIPADQAEKIFERFTKLNDYVQGSGLGLSICRDIAGRMGAKVYLDTTYTEGGARFVFEVPIEPNKQ